MNVNIRTCNASCPSDNDMVAMLEGLLSQDEIQRMEDALDRCTACHELFVELARMTPSKGQRTTSHHNEQEPSHQYVNQYQIIGELGIGGMGIVLEAFDTHLQRKVALKLLRPDVLQGKVQTQHASRLLQEARLLANLHHPNIPIVYEVGLWKERVFMVIQLIKGRSFRTWIHEKKPGWDKIVKAYLQVGRGIQKAHQDGIIHRDVKPDNMLIDASGTAYITDFGLAKPIASGKKTLIGLPTPDYGAQLPVQHTTDTGIVVGTLTYMSPEQRQGQLATPLSDQYAFCFSLYESLCGIHPSQQSSGTSNPLAQIEEEPLYIPQGTPIPPELFSALKRGLKKAPIERFESMEPLLQVLADTIEEDKRSWLPWASGLLVLILLAAFATWQFVKPSKKEHKPVMVALSKTPPPGHTTPLLSPKKPNKRSAAEKTFIPPPVAEQSLQGSSPQDRPSKTRPATIPEKEKKGRRSRGFKGSNKRAKNRRKRRRFRSRSRRLAPTPKRKMPLLYSKTNMDKYNYYFQKMFEAIKRHQGKRCMMYLQKIAHLSKDIKTLRDFIPLYRGRCLMISNKCKHGQAEIRRYFAKKNTAPHRIRSIVNSYSLQFCPSVDGSWREQIKRFSFQARQAKDRQRHIPLCRKLERESMRLWKQHHRKIMRERYMRRLMARGSRSLAYCYNQGKKSDCPKILALLKDYYEMYYNRAPLSRGLQATMFRRFYSKFPQCSR